MTKQARYSAAVVLLGATSCVLGEVDSPWNPPPACRTPLGGACPPPTESNGGTTDSGSDSEVGEVDEVGEGSTTDADLPALCTAPSWRTDETYHPGDLVQSGGHVYACTPLAASEGCETCSRQAPVTSTSLPVSWTRVGACQNGEPPVLDRADVDGYFAPPSAFILASGSLGSTVWQYTTTEPAQDWTRSGFDASSWQTGAGGFFGGAPLLPGDALSTLWPAADSDLWLRTSFSITSCEIPQAMLWARWDDSMEVYINGVEALRESGWTSAYRYVGLGAAARRALKPGLNTIAVHVRDLGGAKYFDLGIAPFGALTDRPVSGEVHTAELAAYGETVRRFMVEHGIPAGVLAVMKRDTVVVAQGFGWADKAFTRELASDAVLRIASNDKPITHAAARTMLDAGTLDPITGEPLTDTTPVFPLLAAHGLTPLPGETPDSRISQVLVEHLIEHRAGLQDLPALEPYYSDLEMAPGTTTAVDAIRWVYSQPPWFSPGSAEQYSNAGYMVLRHLIHVVEGDLLGYLRDTVLAPVGTRDVFIAHERLSDRSPREPWYATFVEPYDRWVYLEHNTTLASTAEALTRFMRGYHLDLGTRLVDPVTGVWAAVPDNGFHVFVGAFEGTWSLAVQRRWDEVNIAVIFNQAGAYDSLTAELIQLTDTLPESAWGDSVAP